MKTSSTKRALLASLLSVLLCVSMLAGSTFAWFTDTASTAVNSIQSGNLKVELWQGDVDEKLGSDTLKWVAEDNRAQDAILWEPGATYDLESFRIKNNGNLALKYKVLINGLVGEADLLNAIDFTVRVDGTALVAKDGTSTVTTAETLNNFEGKLGAWDVTGKITITGHMKEDAGNEYMNKKIEGISITVVASQDTVEKDRTDDQYDKDATYLIYPEGMTKDDFTPEQKAVDENGNFYTSFVDAMENVADNGTLYFKEDSVVDFPTHLNVTKSVTIYGNGADFSGKDISIGTYAAPENGSATINIYDAKNLVVWGQPVGDRADTWNVNFYNCENDGYNFLMYRGAETGTATLNLTMTNCKSTGYTDSIVHTTADGSIVLKNCTFENNCAPVNIAHKQSGTMTVTVEDCKFTDCGKVDPSNDYFAPARFVNNNADGTLIVNLTNNSFAGTIGTNGDILLGDYREGKASHAISATITTSETVKVKSSADAAYDYNGGTIEIH